MEQEATVESCCKTASEGSKLLEHVLAPLEMQQEVVVQLFAPLELVQG